MNPWIVAAWVVTIGSVSGLAGALLWMRFRSRTNRSAVGSGFSFERYRVMERLLSSRDADFLASHCAAGQGLGSDDISRWKRDSVKVFRLYLGELTADFDALHALARRMVAESQTESPELASTLVRQQMAFFQARLSLEVRVVLFRWGIGTVDVAPLLQMVERMRLDLSQLTPEVAQSA